LALITQVTDGFVVVNSDLLGQKLTGLILDLIPKMGFQIIISLLFAELNITEDVRNQTENR